MTSAKDIAARLMQSTDVLIPAPSRPLVAGEHVGDDGLIYCDVCGKRRQMRMRNPLTGEMALFNVACECMIRKREAEEKERAVRIRQQKLAKLRSYSLLDEQSKDSRFENWRATEYNTRALEISRNYVRHFPDMLERNVTLLLYGPAGTGKTFASACIANALMDVGESVVMTSLVKIISGTYVNDEQQLIDRINTANLLVLDDLGAERSSDYAIERVFNLIDSRTRVKKPMVITTNLDVQTIKSAADIRLYRIYDRILTNCYPVQFTGPSFRVENARDNYRETRDLLEGRGK